MYFEILEFFKILNICPKHVSSYWNDLQRSFQQLDMFLGQLFKILKKFRDLKIH